MTKECRKCGTHKPLSDFYVRKSSLDGHRSWCKDCDKKSALDWGVKYRGKAAKYLQQWKKKNPGKVAGHKLRHRLKHPEKVKARSRAAQAARNGILEKSLCPCGRAEVEAHHEDYSKPLEVIWLCHRCHIKLHSERNSFGKARKQN